MNHRARAGSGTGRLRPLAVAVASVLSLRAAALATPDHGESDNFAILEICSDDTPESAAAFLRATRHVLLESKIRLRIRCAGAFPASEGPLSAAFVADEDGVVLQLVSPAENQSTRRILWLADARAPLHKTLALGKATALGLLLESLTADLQAVNLRPLPVPSAPPGPVAMATGRAPSNPQWPSLAAASRKDAAVWEVALPLVGVAWMPPSTLAPQMEGGLAWGGPRWWAVADGVLQLDSNFEIEGRTFRTAGYGLRLGIRRTVFQSSRFRWDADATLAGHLSQYRRDDIPNTETRSWFDLGAGVHSRAAVRVARHVSALLLLGVQTFPTARLASIPDGPSRRVNLVMLSALAGLSVDF